MKKQFEAFSLGEKILWSASSGLIVLSFLLFHGESYMTLAASLVGVTSLILNAKGYPSGQILMVVFSLLYGMISYTYAYYGEMITYLGMTAPMALAAYLSWKNNPFCEGKAEVKVNQISKRELLFLWILTMGVTAVFYVILKTLHTANIIPSTISVTTSFLAVYLTWRRSPYYAIGYAANDLVLIVLWAFASYDDRSYLSVVVCFLAFLANDVYGFVSWKRMEQRQAVTAVQK